MHHRSFLVCALACSLLAGCVVADDPPLASPPVLPGGDPPAPSDPGPTDVAPAPLPNDFVPMEGSSHPKLAEVDDAIKAFMRATCTGAVAFALGFGGEAIVKRGYGYKSGPPNAACASPTDPFVGGPRTGPHTAFRIGSNAKAITAAILRAVVKERLAALDRPSTDDDVESLRLLDPALDLVSPRVREALSTNLGSGTTGACIPGKLSARTPQARPDLRWQRITLGMLLGHRSGLPRSSNPVTSRIGEMRHFETAASLGQESALTGAPPAARGALKQAVPGADFVRSVTLEEQILGNADLCFAFEPGGEPPAGSDGYSNFGFGLLQHVAEHVSGAPLTAPLGAPEKHPDSLLGRFAKTRLGITAGAESTFGIAMSQPLAGARDPSEPKYRAWDGTSINGLFADTKRPYCVWRDDLHACDGSAFDGAQGPLFNMAWTTSRVPVSYTNDTFAAGVGLLAAEMPLYLDFMAKFWISGAGASPFYGRERASTPSASNRYHVGELLGSHATAAQLVGEPVTWLEVPRFPNGELDLASFDAEAPKHGCELPKGLDFTLAANQVNDAVCAADDEGVCSTRYMALRDVVKQALCNVKDWNAIHPVLK